MPSPTRPSHFAGRNFSPRYFAGLYFPFNGAAAPTYRTMSAALAAALAADAPLAAAFAGGFSQAEADASRKWPYCVFVKQDGKPLYQIPGRGAVKRVTYSFHALSRAGGEAAEALAELLKTRLLPTAEVTPAPLVWERGREISRFAPGPAFDGAESTGLSAGLAPGGKDVFEATVFVTWLVTTW